MERNFQISKIACNLARLGRGCFNEGRGFSSYRRTTSRLSKRGRNELRYAGQGAQRVPALDQRVALRGRTRTNQPGQNQRVWALGSAVAHYHQAREAKDLVEPTG